MAFEDKVDKRTLKRRTEVENLRTRKIMKLTQAKILREEVFEELNELEDAKKKINSVKHPDLDKPSTSSDTREKSPSPNVLSASTNPNIFIIKKRLYGEAAELHEHYIQSVDLSPTQTKRMALGLSGTLDLIDDGQAMLFNDQDYAKIKNTYKKKFGAIFNEQKHQVWLDAFKKCESDGIRKARRYLDSYCGEETLAEKLYQTYKFYDCILSLVENGNRILNPSLNIDNITEDDYVCHVWVPILKHLFSINENESCVRLKVGESVLGDSTDEKAKIYKHPTTL